MELGTVAEAGEGIAGDTFFGKLPSSPESTQGTELCGKIYVVIQPRDLGPDFAPLRGNDRLPLIHGNHRNQRKLAVATG